MTSLEIYIVGLRLIAVQLVVFGIAVLPSTYMVFDTANRCGNPSALAYGLLSASGPLLMVASGLFLAYRSRLSSCNAGAVKNGGSFFIVGARLLGLWLAVTGAAGLLSAVTNAVLISSSWPIQADEFASSAVLLGSGWLLFSRPALVSGLAKGSA